MLRYLESVILPVRRVILSAHSRFGRGGSFGRALPDVLNGCFPGGSSDISVCCPRRRSTACPICSIIASICASVLPLTLSATVGNNNGHPHQSSLTQRAEQRIHGTHCRGRSAQLGLEVRHSVDRFHVLPPLHLLVNLVPQQQPSQSGSASTPTVRSRAQATRQRMGPPA